VSKHFYIVQDVQVSSSNKGVNSVIAQYCTHSR